MGDSLPDGKQGAELAQATQRHTELYRIAEERSVARSADAHIFLRLQNHLHPFKCIALAAIALLFR
jgi:hypothetical protein